MKREFGTLWGLALVGGIGTKNENKKPCFQWVPMDGGAFDAKPKADINSPP